MPSINIIREEKTIIDVSFDHGENHCRFFKIESNNFLQDLYEYLKKYKRDYQLIVVDYIKDLKFTLDIPEKGIDLLNQKFNYEQAIKFLKPEEKKRKRRKK